MTGALSWSGGVFPMFAHVHVCGPECQRKAHACVQIDKVTKGIVQQHCFYSAHSDPKERCSAYRELPEGKGAETIGLLT